jgi:hypothetical protein
VVSGATFDNPEQKAVGVVVGANNAGVKVP